LKADKLARYILENEEVLVNKILKYAIERNYAKYTSTLKEAWRVSIEGFSAALAKVIAHSSSIPEMGPDDDFTKKESAQFGIVEAQKHRSRGVTLAMFLSFMKYYQQAYIDLVVESKFSDNEKNYFMQYIKRFYDNVELGFIVEWAGQSEKQLLTDLQDTNRLMQNEKNKYLTVFESIYDPVILVNKNNVIENINSKATETFLNKSSSGSKYYGTMDTDRDLGWLGEEINQFIDLKLNEVLKEKTIEIRGVQKTFLVKFKKMLDVSQKYSGTVVIFDDITKRLEMEGILRKQRDLLETYAFTDIMTGLSNRRTGLLILGKELERAHKENIPLSICYIDVDNLKKVNDTFGHLEGDHLINRVASCIKSSVREMDAVSRMGGDEFLIIFPGYKEPDAEGVVQKICSSLNEKNQADQKTYPYSFSYGIMDMTRKSKDSVNEAISAADEKMYKNKILKKQHEPG